MIRKVLSILFAFATGVAVAQTPNIVLTQVATGITQPTAVSQCGDDRLFLVEQTGKIKILKNGAVLATPFLNVSSLTTPSTPGGERGLLGLAFAPDYFISGKFYIHYTNTT